METNSITEQISKLKKEDETKWLASFGEVLNHYFDLADSKTKEKLYSEFNLLGRKIQNAIEVERKE